MAAFDEPKRQQKKIEKLQGYIGGKLMDILFQVRDESMLPPIQLTSDVGTKICSALYVAQNNSEAIPVSEELMQEIENTHVQIKELEKLSPLERGVEEQAQIIQQLEQQLEQLPDCGSSGEESSSEGE